jgi:hypothetical protein
MTRRVRWTNQLLRLGSGTLLRGPADCSGLTRCRTGSQIAPVSGLPNSPRAVGSSAPQTSPVTTLTSDYLRAPLIDRSLEARPLDQAGLSGEDGMVGP